MQKREKGRKGKNENGNRNEIVTTNTNIYEHILAEVNRKRKRKRKNKRKQKRKRKFWTSQLLQTPWKADMETGDEDLEAILHRTSPHRNLHKEVSRVYNHMVNLGLG